MPESPNPEKARRAAANPRRPGEQCRATPGRYAPLIDHAASPVWRVELMT